MGEAFLVGRAAVNDEVARGIERVPGFVMPVAERTGGDERIAGVAPLHDELEIVAVVEHDHVAVDEDCHCAGDPRKAVVLGHELPGLDARLCEAFQPRIQRRSCHGCDRAAARVALVTGGEMQRVHIVRHLFFERIGQGVVQPHPALDRQVDRGCQGLGGRYEDDHRPTLNRDSGLRQCSGHRLATPGAVVVGNDPLDGVTVFATEPQDNKVCHVR